MAGRLDDQVPSAGFQQPADLPEEDVPVRDLVHHVEGEDEIRFCISIERVLPAPVEPAPVGEPGPVALPLHQVEHLLLRGLQTPQPTGGGRFPVKYYITAMLFIVFDIEIVFLYPWAVAFDRLGTFALVEMLIFMATVFVAYGYVWRRGGLEWD